MFLAVERVQLCKVPLSFQIPTTNLKLACIDLQQACGRLDYVVWSVQNLAAHNRLEALAQLGLSNGPHQALGQ